MTLHQPTVNKNDDRFVIPIFQILLSQSQMYIYIYKHKERIIFKFYFDLDRTN